MDAFNTIDFFFIPKDYGAEEEYQKGFMINELFINYNSGIQTKNDKLTVKMSIEDLKQIINNFRSLSEVPDLSDFV